MTIATRSVSWGSWVAALLLVACGGPGADPAPGGGAGGGAGGGDGGGEASGGGGQAVHFSGVVDGGRVAPPTIERFAASATALPLWGGQVVLDWSVWGAGSVSIDPTVGDVTALPSAMVVVTRTTTFTLSATNLGGTTRAKCTVTVPEPAGAPTIQSFTSTSASLAAPSWVTLSWAQTDAQVLSIDNGIGSVIGSTSVQRRVNVTTTFNLIAVNPLGSASASVTVTVAPQPAPVISSFYSSPQTITGGGSVTLHWSASHADFLDLDNGFGDVTFEFGSTEALVSQTTTFVLTARTYDGQQVTRSTTVVVN